MGENKSKYKSFIFSKGFQGCLVFIQGYRTKFSLLFRHIQNMLPSYLPGQTQSSLFPFDDRYQRHCCILNHLLGQGCQKVRQGKPYIIIHLQRQISILYMFVFILGQQKKSKLLIVIYSVESLSSLRKLSSYHHISKKIK